MRIFKVCGAAIALAIAGLFSVIESTMLQCCPPRRAQLPSRLAQLGQIPAMRRKADSSRMQWRAACSGSKVTIIWSPFANQTLHAALTEGAGLSPAENLSFQRILPVACITTNSVMIDPIVIASPVNPFRKNA